MNRDDQMMVQFYHEVAKKAADRKRIIDFHGAEALHSDGVA